MKKYLIGLIAVPCFLSPLAATPASANVVGATVHRSGGAVIGGIYCQPVPYPTDNVIPRSVRRIVFKDKIITGLTVNLGPDSPYRKIRAINKLLDGSTTRVVKAWGSSGTIDATGFKNLPRSFAINQSAGNVYYQVTGRIDPFYNPARKSAPQGKITLRNRNGQPDILTFCKQPENLDSLNQQIQDALYKNFFRFIPIRLRVPVLR